MTTNFNAYAEGDKKAFYKVVYMHDTGMFEKIVEATQAWYETMRDTYVGKPVPGYGILAHIEPVNK